MKELKGRALKYDRDGKKKSSQDSFPLHIRASIKLVRYKKVIKKSF